MKIVNKTERTRDFLRSVAYSMEKLNEIDEMNRFALILYSFEKAGMSPTNIEFGYDGDEALGPRRRSFDNYDEFVKKNGLLASRDLLDGISFYIHFQNYPPIRTNMSLRLSELTFTFNRNRFAQESEIDKALTELEKILESVNC